MALTAPRRPATVEIKPVTAARAVPKMVVRVPIIWVRLARIAVTDPRTAVKEEVRPSTVAKSPDRDAVVLARIPVRDPVIPDKREVIPLKELERLFVRPEMVVVIPEI